MTQPTSRTVRRANCPTVHVPLLCARCVCGDHSRDHSQIGCVTLVMLDPHDWICRCLEVRQAETWT